MLWDVPAPYHGDASAIAFADGHAELHSWNNNQTIAPIKHEQNLLSVPSQNSQDFEWLASRMSRRVGVAEWRRSNGVTEWRRESESESESESERGGEDGRSIGVTVGK